MTDVKYWPEDLMIEVQGHAGAGEKGEDLVCAAASTLASTLEQVFLMQDQMEGISQREPDKARFRAWVNKTSPLLAQAFVVMETIATGFAALANEFPDHVAFDVITDKEEGENAD